MKQENLIAYAMSFISFLLDTAKIKDSIVRIILFGSVARGDFTKESDIDIFIDTQENIKEEVEKTRRLFMISETQKKWELKGLSQELSLKVSDLNEWKLKRSIISEGIILYGKVKQTPDEAEFYILLQLSYKNLSQREKLKTWRRLYGHQQKVGKRIYKSEGILDKVKGKRIESGLVIPADHEKEIIEFLKRHKVSYTLRELWSDAF